MKLTPLYSTAAKFISVATFLLTSLAQGATWTNETPTSLATRSLRNFWGTSATNVYAVGGANSSPGLFFRWDGTSWTEPAPAEFSAFAMRGIIGFSATEVWVAGRFGNARQSTDSGASWTNRSTGLSGTFTTNGMWGSSNTDIWVVGIETNTSIGAAYRWNGTTWSLVSVPGLGTQTLQAVWGTAANNVVMVGSGGYIGRWNGTSIIQEPSGTSNALNAVWGLDASNIFATGGNATILRYNGSSWSPFNNTNIVSTVSLNGISGSSASNLYVATGSGSTHVYHWDGTAWQLENTGFGNSMNAIWTDSTGAKVLAGGASQLIAGAATVSNSAPAVTTATQSAVTHNSATLGGNVTADGGASVTERGIVWSTNANPTTADTKVTNGSGTGAFSATVNGLPSNTLIHVRAYATNSVNTSYGTDISFNTLPAPVAISSLNRVNTDPSNAGTVNWTLTFASTVTGLTASNFTLTGAAATGSNVTAPSTTNGGLTWTVPVTTGSTDGTLTLRLANASGLSPSISTSLPYDGQSYTMDKTPPTVLSVVRQTPTGQNTSANSVTFRVTYSEPVALNATEASHFSIVSVNGGTITGTIASVTGTGSTRDVTVNITGGTGEFRLRVID
ncbi:MAG: hypothetical protein JNM99_00010 [Verrucomicrobiaceae bacterium]|nr:hypothetical protein [Verrucomicrobiaceae bacterium]